LQSLPRLYQILVSLSLTRPRSLELDRRRGWLPEARMHWTRLNGRQRHGLGGMQVVTR
jgi:hypothetical protein